MQCSAVKGLAGSSFFRLTAKGVAAPSGRPPAERR
jgi:hypothetical protein